MSRRDWVGVAPFEGPDYVIGEFRGARQFLITTTGKLTGISYKQKWVDGENTAHCYREYGEIPKIFDGFKEDPKHVADPACTCGFYSFHVPQVPWTFPLTSLIMAYGVVENWGRVTAGTQGFRASKARIVALTLHNTNPKPPAEKKRRSLTKWISDFFADLADPEPTMAARIRERYPSVELFTNTEAMLEAHPLTRPPHVPERDWDW